MIVTNGEEINFLLDDEQGELTHLIRRLQDATINDDRIHLKRFAGKQSAHNLY